MSYVSDATPGIRRRRIGRGFAYRGPNGKPIRDSRELARIRTLAIPPAWRRVWICPQPNGHVQATGIDAKGRKQYRYHPRWREVRDATKYDRVAAQALWEMGPAQSRTAARKNVTAAVREAAARLGNTPTIRRRCYVHPGVVASYLNGTLVRERGGRSIMATQLPRSGLSQAEQEVLDFLHELERAA